MSKKVIGPNHFTKFLMRFSPKLFLRLAAKEQKVDYQDLENAMELFGKAKRIDFQPLSSTGGRGLIITLDQKLSLWFFQDGDNFKFDGYEMGEYDEGEVTVFDK